MLPIAPLAEMVVQSSLARLAHSALPDAPQIPPRKRWRLGGRLRRVVRRAQPVATVRRQRGRGGLAEAQWRHGPGHVADDC